MVICQTPLCADKRVINGAPGLLASAEEGLLWLQASREGGEDSFAYSQIPKC